jgi:hypothetical protein
MCALQSKGVVEANADDAVSCIPVFRIGIQHMTVDCTLRCTFATALRILDIFRYTVPKLMQL